MRYTVVLAATVAAMAGCASYGPGDAAREAGDFRTACREWRAVEKPNPMVINNIGACHGNGWDGPVDRAAAIRYYTLAARYGLALAQRNLAQLGEPIPTADLAARSAPGPSGAGAAAAGLFLLQQSTHQPRPPVNCQSYNNGITVQTTCR